MIREASPWSSFVVRCLVLVSLLFLSSCGGSSSRPALELPETPLLTRADAHFVVSVPYARIRLAPDRESEVVGILREADVLRIEAQSPFEDVVFERRAVWYEVTTTGMDDSRIRGWVFGDRGRVYATEERARDAAGSLSR